MELRTISTTYEGKERLTEEQVIPFCDDGGREQWVINLYPQVTYQQMDGFGGAITESAAYVYSLMDPEQKKQMLGKYFGKGEMSYRFVRIPIDSCDFSLGHYEADGNEDDAQLEGFSFERVEKYILPMLEDAEKSYGGKLEITAFRKNNGIVFVLLNRTGEGIPAFIRLKDSCAGFIAAPNSIMTGVIDD